MPKNSIVNKVLPFGAKGSDNYASSETHAQNVGRNILLTTESTVILRPYESVSNRFEDSGYI